MQPVRGARLIVLASASPRRLGAVALARPGASGRASGYPRRSALDGVTPAALASLHARRKTPRRAGRRLGCEARSSPPTRWSISTGRSLGKPKTPRPAPARMLGASRGREHRRPHRLRARASGIAGAASRAIHDARALLSAQADEIARVRRHRRADGQGRRLRHPRARRVAGRGDRRRLLTVMGLPLGSVRSRCSRGRDSRCRSREQRLASHRPELTFTGRDNLYVSRRTQALCADRHYHRGGAARTRCRSAHSAADGEPDSDRRDRRVARHGEDRDLRDVGGARSLARRVVALPQTRARKRDAARAQRGA